MESDTHNLTVLYSMHWAAIRLREYSLSRMPLVTREIMESRHQEWRALLWF